MGWLVISGTKGKPMALALSKPKSVTPAQYLAREEMATNKSEYFRGEIFMMILLNISIKAKMAAGC